MRMRLLCGILIASLTLIAQLDGFIARNDSAAGASYEQGRSSQDPDQAGLIAILAVTVDEPSAGFTNAPDPVPAALANLSAPNPEPLRNQRERLFQLARHSPCAAPQTGPPLSHA